MRRFFFRTVLMLALVLTLAVIVMPTGRISAEETFAPKDAIIGGTLPNSGGENNSGLNLTTSPLPVGIIAKPGETVSTNIRMKNSGIKAERIQVSLLKFSANNDQGQPRLADREVGDDYFDWVTFSQRVLIAEPNVWNDLKMTIQVPKEAQLGYYYAVVFTRAAEAGDGQATVAGGAATLVLLDVPSPNTKRELKITKFSSKKKVYEFLPANFKIEIKNTGNIHLIPAGQLYIEKGDNLELGTVEINKTRGNILPDSDRSFTADWNEGFPLYKEKIEDGKVAKNKNGDNEYNLTWNFNDSSRFRFGKYTARALVVYSDGKRDVPLEATVTFWVIPWRILGVILLFVILLGVSLWTIGRKLWRGAKIVTTKPPTSKNERQPGQIGASGNNRNARGRRSKSKDKNVD